MELFSKSSSMRSRTGCMTCKIRRVKCDEHKPNCLRCSTTGRKYDGYANSRSTLLNYSRSLDLPGTKKQRRAFDYFRSRTVEALCGYFSEEFWEYNVLQASFSQASLRHAAIALGSYHEALDTHSTSGDQIFALRQYTKAISHLSNSLSKGQESPQVALTSCVLFVCFDSFTGQFDSAIAHLRSGLEILHSRPSLENFAFFYRVFVRLSLQTMFLVDKRNLKRSKCGKPTHSWKVCSSCQDMPKEFNSLKQAREFLIDIFDAQMNFFYADIDAHDMSVESQVGGPYKRPMEVIIEQEKNVKKLQIWSDSFDNFLNSSNLALSGRDLRGAILLKIHHCVAANLISSSLPGATCEFLRGNYRRIISLCQSLVNSETSAHRTDLSSDLGIIPALYYVALNTGPPDLRIQALDMLALPRREGTWDSRVATLIIKRTIALEEARLRCPQLVDGSLPAAAVADIHEGVGDWMVHSRAPRERQGDIKIELQSAGGGKLSLANFFPRRVEPT